MIISNNTFLPTNSSFINRQQAPRQTINFGGHVGHDKLVINGVKKVLIHETAFFREPKTLKTATDYLKHKFGYSTKKNVLVGACSSGEEAMSYGMLLDGNTKITGFDLSPNMIKKAKEFKFDVSTPTTKDLRDYYDEIQLSAYKDSYLGFEENHTIKQKRLKKLFTTFFEEAKEDEALKPKQTWWQRFKESVVTGVNRLPDGRLETKTYKLKPSMLDCDFKQADVLDLETLAEPNSVHLFSFRNAMYHLVTKDLQYDRTPVEREKARPIFEKIVKGARKILVDEGLIVFGENEKAQLTDDKLLATVLHQNGFGRLKVDGKTYHNIWRKIPDKKQA